MTRAIRSLRRRPASLQPRPRLLIYCEGRVTEPEYFNGLRQYEQIRLIEVIVDHQGGVPKTLVERASAEKKAANRRAKRAKDENLRYDEVWCVFDVDEHPLLTEAVDQARTNGISLAVSNPCFELWLLLHFVDQRAHLHRREAQRSCGIHIRDFDKHLIFPELQPLVGDAIRRASQLEEWQKSRGCAGENPSTDVHKLVARLMAFSKAATLREIDRAKGHG